MEERRTKLLEDERTPSQRMEKAAKEFSALESEEDDQAKALHESMGRLAMDLMTTRKELSKIEKLEDQPHKLQLLLLKNFCARCQISLIFCQYQGMKK